MSTDTGLAERFRHRFGPFADSLDRTTATVVAMVGLDVVWWVLLYTGEVPMPGMTWLMQQGIPMAVPGAMELGVFHVGTPDAFVGYLVMWGVMMWAMMYPAMTRFTREYAAAHGGSGFAAMVAVAGFLTGYQVVWALSGVIPLGFDALLPGGIYGFTRAYTHLVIGGVLVFTGIYQLSSFKQTRLRTCCARIEPHDHGIVTALERGVVHGGTCVLICLGPFFLVMPSFGEMNLFWMAALTGVVTIERLPEWGEEIATASGVVALLAGLVVLALQPSLPLTFVV